MAASWLSKWPNRKIPRAWATAFSSTISRRHGSRNSHLRPQRLQTSARVCDCFEAPRLCRKARLLATETQRHREDLFSVALWLKTGSSCSSIVTMRSEVGCLKGFTAHASSGALPVEYD